ncbi:MAG: hypothetical protein RL685_4141 [Pseudomonadota bacterium]
MLTLALCLRPALAQSPEVPIRLQVALLARAVEYDRSFPARARERVASLIVVRANDPDSVRVGEQIRLELGALDSIAGLPHTERVWGYGSAAELASQLVKAPPAILYLSTGLGEEVGAIATLLEGISILSVAVSARYVPQRAVLGFDAESGRPQLLVHLEQARRQRVAFRPEFLRMVKVVQ